MLGQSVFALGFGTRVIQVRRQGAGAFAFYLNEAIDEYGFRYSSIVMKTSTRSRLSGHEDCPGCGTRKHVVNRCPKCGFQRNPNAASKRVSVPKKTQNTRQSAHRDVQKAAPKSSAREERLCPLCADECIRLKWTRNELKRHFISHHLVALDATDLSALLESSGIRFRNVVGQLRNRALERISEIPDRKDALRFSPAEFERRKALHNATDQLLAKIFREGTGAVLAEATSAKEAELLKLVERKWREISEGDISFGLDPTRIYQVPIDVPALRELGFIELAFYVGNLRFPSVGVSVTVGDDHEFPMRLEAGSIGMMPGSLRARVPPATALLLTMVALFYYFDLLIKEESPRTEKGKSEGTTSRISNTRARRSTDSVRTREIPRGSDNRKRSDRKSAVESQTSAHVDAFRRKLPSGQSPSLAKIVEADQYGINLAGPGYPEVRYTWVRPHHRGDATAVPDYTYHDYRAVGVLSTLLDALMLASASASKSRKE